MDEQTRALLDEDAEVFLHQSPPTPCLNVLERCGGSTITDLQGRELLDFLGVELVLDRASREPAPDAAEQVLYAALRRGLSFKVSSGNVLTLMPP